MSCSCIMNESGKNAQVLPVEVKMSVKRGNTNSASSLKYRYTSAHSKQNIDLILQITLKLVIGLYCVTLCMYGSSLQVGWNQSWCFGKHTMQNKSPCKYKVI